MDVGSPSAVNLEVLDIFVQPPVISSDRVTLQSGDILMK